MTYNNKYNESFFRMKMIMFGFCLVYFYCRLLKLIWSCLSGGLISTSSMVVWVWSVLVNLLCCPEWGDPSVVLENFRLWVETISGVGPQSSPSGGKTNQQSDGLWTLSLGKTHQWSGFAASLSGGKTHHSISEAMDSGLWVGIRPISRVGSRSSLSGAMTHQ